MSFEIQKTVLEAVCKRMGGDAAFGAVFHVHENTVSRWRRGRRAIFRGWGAGMIRVGDAMGWDAFVERFGVTRAQLEELEQVLRVEEEAVIDRVIHAVAP